MEVMVDTDWEDMEVMEVMVDTVDSTVKYLPAHNNQFFNIKNARTNFFIIALPSSPLK